jgi:hypothetical protein
MMAVSGLLMVLGVARHEVVTAILPVITAVLGLADANVPDEETDNADSR